MSMATDGEKPNFTGYYKHVKNENYDEFLQANGAPWIARKMAVTVNPDLEITQNGNNFVLKLTHFLFSSKSEFTVGQEFVETQHTGVVSTVKPTWEDNKLAMYYNPKEGTEKHKPHKTTRELKDNKLIMTMEIDDVKCIKTFEKRTS